MKSNSFGGSLLPTCFIGCDAEKDTSKIVLFGAPFDGTVTFRPGSRFAPSVMRADSYGLETYSPYLDGDIEDSAVYDVGDLELPFGNVSSALDAISSFTQAIFAAGKKPLMIGGEHLVSLPAVSAAFNKYPDLCLIHFDAHTDLRDEYCGEKLSHSSVLRRIWDFLGDERIFQFGIRSGTREEFEWAALGHTMLHKYDFSGLEKTVKAIGRRSVYLTIDLDVLDPSIFAGTGTPEAGGVTFKELICALQTLRGLNFVGGDVVELAPHYDASGVSTVTACKVLRELAIIMAESKT